MNKDPAAEYQYVQETWNKALCRWRAVEKKLKAEAEGIDTQQKEVPPEEASRKEGSDMKANETLMRYVRMRELALDVKKARMNL